VKNSSNPSKVIPASEVTSETIFDYELSDLKADGFSPPKQQVKAKAKAPEKSSEPQLTAAMLEEIQQQAHKEGYEEGRKEGFEFGHKEALESYRKKFEEKLKEMDKIISALAKPFEQLDEQVENEIVELVISMVKQLVRREMHMEPDHIVGIVRDALAILPVSSRDISVVLNPADAEIIREAYSMGEREENWKIIEEPTLNRGGCKIHTAQSSVDATLESRLDAMIAPLINAERKEQDGEGLAGD